MTAMIPCLDRSGFLPRLSTHHQSRARLTEPLLASTARVKLLCAPAGSGKTALLAECLLQAPTQCRVHWLPLSGVASSAAEFRHRLAETLGQASSSEKELLGYLARLQTPTWLFLDDYCRVPNPESDLLLDRMLAVSSPMLTWWLGARRRPPCNWPRLLLDDELYECESTSLAFTPGEVEQILQPWVPEQASKVASRIIQRTGGWCAGVRIAMLHKCDWSRQDKPLGRADTLLDYLEHELFSSLTPELSEAWRVLAHLPRFNARLCDHLFGAGEGAQYLRTLQALGCFIEPWGIPPIGCRYSPRSRSCCAMNNGRRDVPGIVVPANGSVPNRTGNRPSNRHCSPRNTKWRSACCSTSVSSICSRSKRWCCCCVCMSSKARN